jgi:hypothetical protein
MGLPRASMLITCSFTVLVASTAHAQASPAEPPETSDSTECTVVVVDAANGAPVPDVEITWDDDRFWLWPLPSIDAGPQAWDNVPQVPHHRRVRTDPNGRARVTFGSRTVLRVMAGERRGSLVVSRGDGQPSPLPGEQRLSVVPHAVWPLHVRGVGGEPIANVSVELRVVVPERPLDQSFVSGSMTDAAGRAELAVPRQPLLGTESLPPPRLAARVMLAGVAGPEVEFDVNTAPALLELKPPPCARVRARVTAAGQPLSFSCVVGLSIGGEAGAHGLPGQSLGSDGATTFSSVPLGGDVRATFYFGDLQRHVDVARPRQPGELVEAVLDFDVPPLVVRGRVVDETGVAFGSGVVSLHGESDDGPVSGQADVDRDGRFACFVAEDGRQRSWRVLSIARQPRGGIEARAELGSLTLRAGDNDLGTVELRRQPRLATIRYRVGDEPIAAPHAIVEVAPAGARDDDAHAWQWRQELSREFRWAGEIIWGDAGDDRLRVRVQDEAYLPRAPVGLPRGSDVVVSLERAHRLRAQVELPQGLAADTLRMVLVADGGAGEAKDAVTVEASARGAVATWNQLPPGRYTMEVGPAAWPQPALRVRDVEVPMMAGEDPRLQAIDLRPKMHMLKVRVELPARPHDDESVAAVFLDPPESGKLWHGFPLVGDHALVPVPLPLQPQSLLVAASGCQPQWLHGVRGNVATKLTLWPVHRVVVDLPFELPADVQAMVVVEGGGAQIESLAPCLVGERYVSGHELLRPKAATVMATQAEVPAADVERRVSLVLLAASNVERLTRLTPATVPAGAGLTRIRVDGDHLREMLRKLQARR